MGMRSLSIACLLWVIAISFSNAADENESFRFSSSSPQVETRSDNPFPVPEVARDGRFDEMLSEAIAENVMDFAQKLGATLDRDQYPNTQIFSPLSIMSALSLLHMGASGNTYQQLSRLFTMLAGSPADSRVIHEEFGWMLQDVMLNTKNLARPRDEVAWRKTPANPNAFGKGGNNTPNEHIIRVANGLFVQQGFSLRPQYRSVAESVYKSEVTPLDFRYQKDRAKNYINSWVNQNTLGKIPAIITDEVDSNTNMILASALYFKGFWQQPFLAVGTSEANFYPDGRDNPAVKILLMSSGGVLPYYDAPEYGCHIIGLPYKGNLTTMYIIQPHESTRRKLYDLQNALTGERINDMISKMKQKTAVIAFPKFRVTNNLNLKDPLMKMGIEDIFINGRSDLSLIADEARNQEAPSSGSPATGSSWPATVPRSPVSSTQLQPSAPPPSSWAVNQDTGSRQPSSPPPSSWTVNQENDSRQRVSSFRPQANGGQAVPGTTWPPPVTAPRMLAPFSQTPEIVSTFQQPASLQQAIIQPQPAASNNRLLNQNLQSSILDRFGDPALEFRFGGTDNATTPNTYNYQVERRGDLLIYKPQQHRSKRTVTYKVESEFMRSNLPLRLKDLILNKRITKPNPGKKLSRSRRQAVPKEYEILRELDRMRASGALRNPQLYVDDILHKVDFDVNEQGTEAAAATLTYLRRSGTDVAFRCDAPFMLIIRHDPTKLPLFYGKVNIPLP